MYYSMVSLIRGSGLEQYALPARRIITAAQSNYIRKDWLEQLNMDVPTNIERTV